MSEPVYIVSGLPRSGTSMIMQALEAGGFPVATDGKRQPDESNPKGYLEIDSIINKLKDNPDFIFNFEDKVVKVIAYGIQYLPSGSYRVIYVERDIDEVLDSMEKMIGAKDEGRSGTREAFIRLNDKMYCPSVCHRWFSKSAQTSSCYCWIACSISSLISGLFSVALPHASFFLITFLLNSSPICSISLMTC